MSGLIAARSSQRRLCVPYRYAGHWPRSVGRAYLDRLAEKSGRTRLRIARARIAAIILEMRSSFMLSAKIDAWFDYVRNTINRKGFVKEFS